MRRRERDTPPVDDEAMLGILRQLASLDERLGRVEAMLAEAELDRVAQAEQEDLIDLRLHSARLAAELSRVTVALQARIDEIAGRQGDDIVVDLDHDVPDLPPPVDGERRSGWEPAPDD